MCVLEKVADTVTIRVMIIYWVDYYCIQFFEDTDMLANGADKS